MKISLCGLGVLKKKEMTSFHTIVRWEGMEIRCNLRSKSKKNSSPHTGPCLCFGIEQNPKAAQRTR